MLEQNSIQEMDSDHHIQFEEVIEALLADQDVLLFTPQEVIARDCYELAASMRNGLCLVILQNAKQTIQQAERIQDKGWNSAFLDTELNSQTLEKLFEEAQLGHLKFLLITPEQLNPLLQERLKSIELSLMVIESSHCISAWGHDFRLEFIKFQNLKKSFPKVPILALSGLANYIVQKDIQLQLGISEAKIIQTSFDFPNLHFAVQKSSKPVKNIEDFLLLRPTQKGIIYCKNQNIAESLCKELQYHGFSSKAYYSEYTFETRLNVENEFYKDQLQIVCLSETDVSYHKFSDYNWVIHLNIPLDIESYYQQTIEIGLSGLSSESLLILQKSDIQTHQENLSDHFEAEKRMDLAQMRLTRMIRYSKSQVCRRRALLAYFNQIIEKDCENCDFCEQEREQFDGTIFAQKALSAILRTQQKSGLKCLIYLLRGTLNEEMIEKGFDKLPTFGVGKEASYLEWEMYFQQLLELGLIETTTKSGSFQLTSISRKVLHGESKIYLYKTSKKTEIKPNSQKKKFKLSDESDTILFHQLSQLRRQLAEKMKIPAFMIFSNKTLAEIAKFNPTTLNDLSAIKGVGEYKISTYGTEFLACILEYNKTKLSEKESIDSVYLSTFQN